MTPYLRQATADIRSLVLAPRAFLERVFTDQISIGRLLIRWVAPFAAIRPAAIIFQSTVIGQPSVGVVLGLGSYALQFGTWLGISLIMPALARQFDAVILERQGFELVTFASIPYWLFGILFLAPESSIDILFWWSRLMVLLSAFYGLYILRQGLILCKVPQKSQWPMVGTVGVAGLLVYLVLYGLTGIGAHIVLWVLL